MHQQNNTQSQSLTTTFNSNNSNSNTPKSILPNNKYNSFNSTSTFPAHSKSNKLTNNNNYTKYYDILSTVAVGDKDDHDPIAIMDSSPLWHYLTVYAPLYKIHCVNDGANVKLSNGEVISSTHRRFSCQSRNYLHLHV